MARASHLFEDVRIALTAVANGLVSSMSCPEVVHDHAQHASGIIFMWSTRPHDALAAHLCHRRAPMRPITVPIILLAGSILAPVGQGQEAPETPEERYQGLLAEYRVAASGGELTDEERLVFVGHAYRRRHELARELLALAEEHPRDPIALEALMQAVWQVNTTPWPVELVGRDDATPRALELLLRDHVMSDRLGNVCQRVSWGFRAEYETFLRTVLERNSNAPVRAQACAGLALYLSHRSDRIELVREQPALAEEFTGLFGRKYLEGLLAQDRAAFLEEAAGLYERTAKEFGDVALPDGGTFGELARKGLYEVRYLTVGMEAPDIEGVDQLGEHFRLADYRGKVVLLDFWHSH